MSDRASLIILDDTPLLARHLAERIGNDWGWLVRIAPSTDEVLHLASEKRAVGIVADLDTLGPTPEKFFKHLANAGNHGIPVVLLVSGNKGLNKASALREASPLIQAVLQKPFAIDQLRTTLESIFSTEVGRQPAAQENMKPRQKPESVYQALRTMPEILGYSVLEKDSSRSTKHGALNEDLLDVVSLTMQVAEKAGAKHCGLLVEMHCHTVGHSWLALLGDERHLVVQATSGVDLSSLSHTIREYQKGDQKA